MEHELPTHEKVKFRGRDVAELHTLPSAIGQDFWKKKPSLHRRALAVVAAVAALAVSMLLFLHFVGLSGISTDSVRDEAEAAVAQLLGSDVNATLGPARISFDGLIGIEVNDVKLVTRATLPADVVTAKSIRFGLQVLPLVTGQVRVGSARVEDARIFVGALPAHHDTNWAASLAGEDGLIDPDLVANAVFSAVHHLFDAFSVGSTRSVELENVQIILAEGSAMRSIVINRASLSQSLTGRLSFSAKTAADGREVAIEGTAARDQGSDRIGKLDLSVSSSPLEVPVKIGTDTVRDTSIGKLDLGISGKEGGPGEPSRLDISLQVGDTVVRIDPRNDLDIGMTLAAELVTGTGKLEIRKGSLNSGRSRFDFSGAIGPKPRSDPSEAPTYRYEFVSNQATLAPPDSPEPVLKLGGRLAGTFDPVSARLEMEELGVRTPGGEVLGKATVEFVAGKAPGIFLVLSVPEMPTSHVKQIWPWMAASGARRWTLANLFGGQVTEGHLQLRAPPGRLGNGVPMTGDDISGHFKVTGTRFDTTGHIPAVRDAVGTIDFRGNDIDIALSSGTVFLPSGRSVAASNGTLTIRKANQPKIIGALDIDVAGDARAVTELASLEPINAMRHAGMTSDEFSGRVSGNVKADIPLSKAAQGEKLNWLVALDFDDLAVSRAFDGQLMTGGDGKIVVDPAKAVIVAKAKLNGAPAEIDLIEPLGNSSVARRRKVAVVLDNKAREKLAPGLATLLDGTVKVRFDAGAGTRRQMEMDLTDARLDLPWIGWSKGPGVAATASFGLTTSDKKTTLSDFRLDGKTFAVGGNITLDGGELSSARFDKVQLNRDDDVDVAIKRTGKGYSIDVTGASLDARSLVKQVTTESAGPSKAASTMAVTVNASVKALTGFNGERLSDVKLEYSGTGDRVDGLNVSAATDTGNKLTILNTTERGRRSLEMRSNDAGSVLRFLDIYQHMEGGTIRLALAGDSGQPMRGQIDASDFWIVNEPKLASIVATTPPGDERSLNQAVRKNIDTSRVQFERGFAAVEKGPGSLLLDRGVLRGPLIGLSFQGTLYDQANNMNMTGTFMPAYGLNRIFGEIPLFGEILGNGRDRGLIGVTFRLAGKASSPVLQINPLSVIAPGIFRSIFEFR